MHSNMRNAKNHTECLQSYTVTPAQERTIQKGLLTEIPDPLKISLAGAKISSVLCSLLLFAH